MEKTHISSNIDEKKDKFYQHEFFVRYLSFAKYFFFDCLKSLIRSSYQASLRLIKRQSRCSNSASVVYSDGKGKVSESVSLQKRSYLRSSPRMLEHSWSKEFFFVLRKYNAKYFQHKTHRKIDLYYHWYKACV